VDREGWFSRVLRVACRVVYKNEKKKAYSSFASALGASFNFFWRFIVFGFFLFLVLFVVPSFGGDPCS